MKQFLTVFTSTHALASLFALLAAFAVAVGGIAGADVGLAGHTLTLASDVLLFPLASFVYGLEGVSSAFPGPMGWIPVIANSLLWAILAWSLYRAILRSRALVQDQGPL